MISSNQKNFLAGIVGNILDRYDMALYGIMATFMASNFFPGDEQIVSIIKVYGIMFLGIFTRPIGALFFGQMAMKAGPRKVMIICLSGVAITTGAIGILPSYNDYGIISPALLILVRIFQGFFASGENTVAAFFLISHSSKDKATRTSGIYNFSTMLGVVIASAAGTLVSMSNNPEFYWRIPYLFGFFTAIAGIILRSQSLIDRKIQRPKTSFLDVLNLAITNRMNILRIVMVSSFSYITYTIPFVFMNNFIPQITDVTIVEMLQFNTILLILDTALIPVFTIISESFDRKKFMALMSFIIAITIIPLFIFIEGQGILYIMIVRIIIIFAGLAYLAPIYAWYYSLFKGDERYPLVGIGYSIGEVVIGRNSTAICLWLWYYFQSTTAPAIFISSIALFATIALLTTPKNIKTKNNY